MSVIYLFKGRSLQNFQKKITYVMKLLDGLKKLYYVIKEIHC